MEANIDAPQSKRRKCDPANKEELNLSESNETNHAAQDKTDSVAPHGMELENLRCSNIAESQETGAIKGKNNLRLMLL